MVAELLLFISLFGLLLIVFAPVGYLIEHISKKVRNIE